MAKFDVVVIGAGPGGYVAAIRAAQLGLKTACVDKWVGRTGKPSPGGTCLNVGCIPSKALLDSSHHFHDAAHLLPSHGIEVGELSLDLGKMMARKDKVVENLTRGISGLLRKNKIEFFPGTASFEDAHTVVVASDGEGKPTPIEADHIIIATGSVPIDIPVARVDGDRIVDNEGALAFDAVPERLGVIGAGVIGLELGSVWNRLGSKVTVLEALEDFLPAADRQIAGEALKAMKKQGLDIRLGAKVTAATAGSDGVEVQFEQGGSEERMEFDRLVVAVGRRAYTEGLKLDAAGVSVDERGRIQVDGGCRTTTDGIYAIGDVVTGPMLAHKASEEGIAVAESIAGMTSHIDHSLMPWVIYTHPEIAWAGETEQELEARGVEFRAGTFPFLASGRAQASGDAQGIVKVIADAQTDRILGVHLFSASASELIAEAVTAMAFHGSAEDIARTIHAHPTLAEAMHEAALAVDGRTIHI